MAKRAGGRSTKNVRRISRARCGSAAMPGRSYRKRTRNVSTMYIAAESFDIVSYKCGHREERSDVAIKPALECSNPGWRTKTLATRLLRHGAPRNDPMV